jgi:ribosomal-protein-alanine N-acetyltransferase
MAEFALRDYLPGDADAMYELDLVCFEPPFRFSRRAMRRFAQAPGATTILADAEGKLAGFCIVQLEGDAGYVVTLDVAPEFRRRGLAQRLIAEAEARTQSAGGDGMALHVFHGNVAAIQFYESIGYGRTGLARDFYGRGMDALVYCKQLAE